MSSRQQSRLARAKGLEGSIGLGVNGHEEEEDDDSSGEEELEEKGPSLAFSALDDDSSDEDSGESDEEESADVGGRESSLPDTAGSSGRAAAAARKPDEKKALEEEDDALLDNIISQLNETRSQGREDDSSPGDPASTVAQLLSCDPRSLKVDNELRRRFGSSTVGGGGGGGQAGQGNRPVRGQRRGLRAGQGPTSLALKRLLVTVPKDDWPRPPSSAGGGMGMVRAEAPANLPAWQLGAHGGAEWFVFQPSDAYQQVQRRFEVLQAMHDPNTLAVFAAQVPYHAEALLQLGMVFAHTGQMDRASEFVGRSLYVLESACCEPFKPAEGRCRMDASRPENSTYFAALFRFMQMAGMMGCTRTALELGKLLLSLDPLGDPMGVLLALDYYALACKKGDFAVLLHASDLPVGYSAAALEAGVGLGGEVGGRGEGPGAGRDASGERGGEGQGEGEGAAVGGERNGTGEGESGGLEAAGGESLPEPTPSPLPAAPEAPSATVRDLPGLNYSLALALLDIGDPEGAQQAMKSALLRFPEVLEPLLEKLFAERGGELWKHERAQELLYDGAGLALQRLPAGHGVGEGTAAAMAAGTQRDAGSRSDTATGGSGGGGGGGGGGGVDAYGPGSPLEKYLSANVTDYRDSFPTLPAEANPLDPRLMGPNMMNQRFRLRGAAAGGGPGAGEDRDLLMVLLAQQEAAEHNAGGRGGAGGGGGNLDPNDPLAQLLWQTLLPWNSFPTPLHPPPPPPP